MNKIYRTVYNETTGTWVAVCETAKTHTKSSGKSSVVKAMAAAGLMAVAGVSVAATTSTGGVAQQANASQPTAKVETEAIASARTSARAMIEFFLILFSLSMCTKHNRRYLSTRHQKGLSIKYRKML